MVAASKMRKAQQAAIEAQPFARLLYRIQRSATTHAPGFEHPLLERPRGAKTARVILIAADKGLCGALNTNVFRLASQFDPATTVFITAGRKAAQFVARTERQLAAEFAYGDTPTFPEARAIAALARDLFVKGEVDRGAARHHPVRQHADAGAGDARVPAGRRDHRPARCPASSRTRRVPLDPAEAVFEPSSEGVLGYLLDHYLNIYLYYVLLNAKASEQSARMVSMKNATDSAEDLIKDLKLEYNKLRQGNITRELLEIAAAGD